MNPIFKYKNIQIDLSELSFAALDECEIKFVLRGSTINIKTGYVEGVNLLEKLDLEWRKWKEDERFLK